MELEALKEIDPAVRQFGARIVVLTPELERYTRALHKKLGLPFDILTDLHLKIAEQFGLVFTFPDYLRDLYKSFGRPLIGFMTNRSTASRCPLVTSLIPAVRSGQRM